MDNREIERAKEELHQAVYDIVVKKDLDSGDYYIDISPTSCEVDLSVLSSHTQLVKDYVNVSRTIPIGDELFNKAYARLEREYKQGISSKKNIKCEYDSDKDSFVCTDSKQGGEAFEYHEID